MSDTNIIYDSTKTYVSEFTVKSVNAATNKIGEVDVLKVY